MAISSYTRKPKRFSVEYRGCPRRVEVGVERSDIVHIVIAQVVARTKKLDGRCGVGTDGHCDDPRAFRILSGEREVLSAKDSAGKSADGLVGKGFFVIGGRV